MAASSPFAQEEPWLLYYWPSIKGRGEYVRLVFEEAGVPYSEPAREAGKAGFQAIVDFVWGHDGGSPGNPGFPARAPPAITRGGVTVSNTPVVMSYLGRKYGLHGATLEEQAHVDQLLAVLTDGVQDARLAFHPLDFYATHKGQEEASRRYIEQFGKDRLPKYIRYFEGLLARATPQVGGERYLVGDKLTVADLHYFHFIRAADVHYKSHWDAIEAPLSRAFLAHVAARPRIAAYLADTTRQVPWDTDSFM